MYGSFFVSRGGAGDAGGTTMTGDDQSSRWMVELDIITSGIIDNAIKIHRALGPGLLESVYDSVLVSALEQDGFRVESQKSVRFEYNGMVFSDAFRADLVVNGRVIVEVKSIEKTGAIHKKQLLTYLRLMKLPVGLLINFGQVTLKEGLHRIVNNLDPSNSPNLRVNQRRDLSSP